MDNYMWLFPELHPEKAWRYW